MAQAEPKSTAADTTQSGLSGTLRTAGDRAPIAGARVMAVPAARDAKVGPLSPAEFLDPSSAAPAWIRTAETDEEGRFTLKVLGASRVRLIVVAAGHARTEVIVDALDLPRRGLVVFAEPDEEAAYRTVVETPESSPVAQVKSTAMDAEEIRTAPGTQGDPLRALQNLPGVARSPGGLGVLVLRGASPNQSRVFLGGHPLPRAFHALAVASVVPAAAIDRLEFVPGNFGSRYGDTTGGIVVLHPAQLQREGTHGHARMDLVGVGAVASGPLGRGAYLVAAQRGWVDVVLRAVETIDPAQTFLLPRYYDYQAFFDYPVGHRGVLSARVLGAGDRVQSRTQTFSSSGEDREIAFELGSQFHRADLSYRVQHPRWSFLLTPSVRFERNLTRSPRSETASIRNDGIFSLRAEGTRRLTQRAELTLGADVEVDRYRTRVTVGFTPTSSSELEAPSPQTRRAQGLQTASGSYLTLKVRVGRWTLAPGLRASAFTIGQAAEAALDPRLSTHWAFAPRWKLSIGAGLYSQALIPQRSGDGDFIQRLTTDVAGAVRLPGSIQSLEPRAGFAPVTDAIDVARAFQGSAAMSREVGEFWRFELGAWTRLRDNADGQSYALNGSVALATKTWSTAYGLEVLARRSLGPRLWGWLGYTLSAADTRILDPIGERTDQRVIPSTFDQRHNLVMLASYRLPQRWRVGGRFRLVTGSPFTDVVGSVWAGPYSFSGVAGLTNESRFPLFHQLDLRVDKSWVLRRVEVGAYLDVQNVYNRVNPEAYIYDYDLRSRTNAIGLPIFPSLGLRIDY